MQDRVSRIKFGLALLLPFLAWGLQSLLWEFVTPFAAFFFYPAVFLSSWLGGRRVGLLATLISLVLIAYFFIEPVHTFNVMNPNALRFLLMFLMMGVTFALTLGRIQVADGRRRAVDTRFRTLFEEALLGVAVIDSQNGQIHEINPRFAEIVGRTREELVRIDWMAITHPDDVQDDLDQMARLNAGEIGGFQMDKRYLKPDGAVVWVHMTIAPLRTGTDEARRHFCLIEDISERRAAEQRQVLADERLRLANDIADIGVWDWDLQNNRMEWDERMCDWFGLTPEERQSGYFYDRWRNSVHPDDLAAAEAGLQHAIATSGHWDTIFRVVRPDGVLRTMHCVAIVHFDEQQQPLRALIINQDITLQQERLAALTQAQTELERLASDVRLGALLDQGLIGIVELDADGHMTRVNDRFAEMLGYTHEELQGQTVQDITDPRDSADSEAHLRRLRQHGQSFLQEKRYRRKSGECFWAKVMAMPVVDPKTQTPGVLALIVDIDSAKQAEQRLRLALDASQVGMYDWDIVSGHILWTSEHERLWGYRIGEFDGSYQGFARRVHPDDLAEVNATIEATKTDRQPYRHEFRVVWPDGSVHWMNVRGEFEYDTAGRALRMRGTVLDITESVQSAEELREQKERFSLAMDASRDGLWDWKVQTGDCYYSPGWYRMLDLEPASLPAHVDSFLGLLHPDERESMLESVGQLLETKSEYAIEFHMRNQAGGYIWVLSRGKVIDRDADGKPLRALGVHTDITERKKTVERLEELNQTLEQRVLERTAEAEAANRAKSHFLASMSHEIRTPMNAVLGLAQLLEDEPLTENQQQMVQRINTAGRSLMGIINDILDFSKIEAGQLSVEQRPFKLKESLSHINHLLGPVAQGKGLTLSLQEDTPVACRLSGDALRIEQVLINLVGNAIKFTAQGGVTLRVRPISVTESSARLRFEIQDTGIGLSPDAVAKLFVPFTQADSGIARSFGGTGLGLSISKRLVELMGGEIGVESTPSVGSTFWFELPFERLADVEQPVTSAAEVKGPRLQELRLLVVDDSQMNLYVAENLLQREGADVTLMKDGQQALDALRVNPQGFDLVLMDIQMPVMDGLTATRAIREELQLTALPVIALTAGVMAEEKQSALEAGVNDFLPKPMDMDLMASMIRSYCPAST